MTDKEKKETFLCKIGLHKWGAWSEPVSSFAGIVLGYLVQDCECERCGIVKARSIIQ